MTLESDAATTRSFRSNVARTYATQIAFSACVFAATLVTARVLGPSGRGALTLLVLVPTLCTTAFELGQHFTISHLAAALRLPVNVIHGNALAYAAGIALPAGSLSGLAYWLLGPFDIAPVAAAGVAGIAVSAGVYVAMASGLAMGTSRVGVYNGARMLLAAGFLGLVAALAGVGVRSPGFFFVAWTLSIAAAAAFLFWTLRRHTARPRLWAARRQAAAGVRIHLAAVSQLLLLRVDHLILAALAGTAAVGHYSVATNLAEAVWYLPAAAGVVAVPFLSGPASEAEKRHALTSAVRVSLWFPAAAALLLAALAPVAVPAVFGAAFRESAVLLIVLLPGIVAAGAVRIAWAALIARDHSRLMLQLTAGTLAANIALNLVAVPRYGAVGAAVVSTLTYGVLGVLALRAVRSVWRIGTLELVRPPRLERRRRSAVVQEIGPPA